VRDADPAGGFKMLARAADDTVTVTTALGRVSTYGIARAAVGTEDRSYGLPSGLAASEHRGIDGSVTVTQPDGTVVTATRRPDPRFGMQAPVVTSESTTTPSGLTRTVARSRAVSSSDPHDPFGFATITDTETVNGAAWTRVFDRATGTRTATSPMERT